jgi:DNA adenine methylase
MGPSKWISRDAELYKWILRHLPNGYIYVEPFTDIVTPLWYLSKPFPVEVINDLYLSIVNTYRVLQDINNYNAIIDKLAKTPFSQEEFGQAVKILDNPEIDEINKTWAFFVIHTEYLIKVKKGDLGLEKFLNNLSANLPLRLKMLVYWYDRLSRVQIDCVDVIRCIKYWDTSDTIFYIEPPHSLDTEFYENLVDTLLSVRGSVLLYDYEHPAYKKLIESGWHKLHNHTSCFNEVLYLNLQNSNSPNGVERQEWEGKLFDI